MSRITRRLGLLSVVGIVVAGGAVAPSASAAASAQAGLAVVGRAGPTPLTSLPNVNISGVPFAYSPTSLSVTPVTFNGNCTAALAVFTLTNQEPKKKVTVTAEVKPGKFQRLGVLPAGAVADVCIEGSSGAQDVFGLKKSTSQLTVTLN